MRISEAESSIRFGLILCSGVDDLRDAHRHLTAAILDRIPRLGPQFHFFDERIGTHDRRAESSILVVASKRLQREAELRPFRHGFFRYRQ